MNIKLLDRRSKVIRLSPLERLVYWINERESIRRKRVLGLDPPWTDDWILQKYRFCNVRRMDDRVSQWLLKNWYEPYFDHISMLYAIALARFINLPSSLELIESSVFKLIVSWSKIKTTLRKHRELGNTIFNGAYMVRGNDGMDKIEAVVDYYVRPLKQIKNLRSTSMREAWDQISPSYGMGSFMAGQIVADLRWAISGDWEDKDIWAPPGPGSRRGLARLFGDEYKTALAEFNNVDNWLTSFKELVLEEVPNRLSVDISKRLEAIDYQNCLCEFDKYERALWGEGKPKQLYRPRRD